MTATAAWQDVLKENLVGRVIATSEMGISFRGTIDRDETKDDCLYIYPKAWFRLYHDWEPWVTQRTQELGYPEPVIVQISGGVDLAPPDIDETTGEIYFYVAFKGQHWIRYHDCVLQCSDDPAYFEDGCAASSLVYLKDSGAWVIRTQIVFADNQRNNQTIDLYVRHCPICGEKLPKF